MTDVEKSFIGLVRLGIGTFDNTSIIRVTDWEEMMEIASRQGLSAIVLDGIERLSEALRPPKALLLQWIGSTLLSYEHRYELYRRAIAEMAGFYNNHHFKMMVLKGYACSLAWPKPEHRPCGDIDIWLFGRQKEADKVLTTEKGVQIDKSHHHHTVFNWRNFMVENHYDFIEAHYRKSSFSLEKILKEKGTDDTNFVEVYGEKVYIPSPNLHALFLSRHALEHFASNDVNVRQLLDWAFFVKAHGSEVDWDWLLDVLEEYGMLPLFNIINAICIEDLGFDAALFPMRVVDLKVKGRVLNEILSPEFQEEQPNGLIPRVAFKYHRWKANEWKHLLCYKDSRWSVFWRGVWNHMLKPESI